MTHKQQYLIAALAGLVIINVAVLAVFAWPVLVAPPALPTLAVISLPPSPRLASPTLPASDTPTTLPSETPSLLPTITHLPQPALPPTAAPPMAGDACVIQAAGGLLTEVSNAVAAMPGPDSDGMLVPSHEQVVGWQLLISALVANDPAAACSVLAAYAFPYELVDFTDQRFNNERFWLLRENLPTTVGWGTYVIRGGQAEPLIIEAPHALADWRSDVQAVQMFRHSGALGLLVAGTHRCANQDFSPCANTTIVCGQVEPYRTSDLAGAPQTIFQATHQALAPCGSNRFALQIHINSLAQCPDIFISNGTTTPGSRTRTLYRYAQQYCTGMEIDIADGTAGECPFNGGLNVQGLYSNTCAANPATDLCTAPALAPPNPEPFLFVEQSSAIYANEQCLVDAMQALLAAERAEE